MKIVETVAFHLKESPHFETHIISHDIVDLVFRFGKNFSCVLTFLVGRKSFELLTFAKIVYVKFFKKKKRPVQAEEPVAETAPEAAAAEEPAAEAAEEPVAETVE